MKKYTYHTFPLLFVFLGYGIIGLSVFSAISSIDLSDLEGSSGSIASSIGVLVFGLMLVTFRSQLSIDSTGRLFVKEYKVLGRKLSREEIRIPEHAENITIYPKQKRGKGYYKAVIPFGYNIESYDMYFRVNGSVVPIIKTDQKRAIKIAEFIQKSTELKYSVERKN